MKRQYGVSLEEDAVLDRYDLATEAEMMPSLMQHYSELFAKAEDVALRAKTRMKLLEAEAWVFIQDNPPAGGKPPTADTTKALVTTNPKVQEATEEWLTAEAEAGIYKSAVDTMREKSDKIRVLKELLLGGIYNLKD